MSSEEHENKLQWKSDLVFGALKVAFLMQRLMHLVSPAMRGLSFPLQTI